MPRELLILRPIIPLRILRTDQVLGDTGLLRRRILEWKDPVDTGLLHHHHHRTIIRTRRIQCLRIPPARAPLMRRHRLRIIPTRHTRIRRTTVRTFSIQVLGLTGTVAVQTAEELTMSMSFHRTTRHPKVTEAVARDREEGALLRRTTSILRRRL